MILSYHLLPDIILVTHKLVPVTSLLWCVCCFWFVWFWFFLWSAPVAFRRVALETPEWTSRDSNHHQQSVSAGKTNAIPTEPSGRLVCLVLVLCVFVFLFCFCLSVGFLVCWLLCFICELVMECDSTQDYVTVLHQFTFEAIPPQATYARLN